MSAPGSPGGSTLAEPVTASTAGRTDDVSDRYRDQLIDQLIPAEPSRTRRFATALAIVVTCVGLGVLWRIGWIVPQPTLNSVSQQWVTMSPAPDGEHVVIGRLHFETSSLVTLELADIDVDAPGLIVDRITWTDPDSNGELDRQALPAEMPPGSSVLVELWARPETCVDPTGEWGEVRGRWTYSDRPSWWGRWESLDNPLWNPSADPNMTGPDQMSSAISLGPINVDGEEIQLDGPLSAACALLGVQR